MTTQLITVLECFKNWNTENIYTLHTNKEQSIITKKPLQGSDKSKFSLSLRVADTDATFSKIVNGSDKCISVTPAKAPAPAPMMLLVPIDRVYAYWKTDKVDYFYQHKAVVKIAHDTKSNKYQLTFDDSSKLVVDASINLDKIAPKQETAPIAAAPAPEKIEDKVTITYITAPAPAEAPAPAPKLTIDMVKELALQLSLADQATLASQINSAIAAKLSENAPAAPAPVIKPETTVTPAAPAPVIKPETTVTPAAPVKKQTLDKSYPAHHDRLITLLEEKYPGIEIPDILKSWGDSKINGVNKIADKAIGEKYSIGPATVTEELATIAFLMALKYGIVKEYLTKIGVTISPRVAKLSSKDQTVTYNAIAKKWENQQVSFNNINCAVKWHLKTNLDHAIMVMLGKEKLTPKQK